MHIERRGLKPVFVGKRKEAARENLRNTQISFDDFSLHYVGKKLRPEQIPGQIRYEGFLGTNAAEMAKSYASDYKISVTETVARGVRALSTIVDIQDRDEFVVASAPGQNERIFSIPQVESIDPTESTNIGLAINISPRDALFLHDYSERTSAPVNDIINMSVLLLDDIARGQEFSAAAKLRSMKFEF